MSKARNLANLLADGVISADELAEGAALPSQTGQSGKYLSTDGSSASWAALSVVKISGVTYPGDDTAALPAGGQTLTITGSGFSATPIVYVGGTLAPSVTFVSSTQITFTSPAKSAGTYDVYVVNPDGATAISVFGVSYSGVPTWTTAAGSLGSVNGTFSIQLIATSDSSVTYSLSSGSILPTGVTLSSSGLLSGTLEQEQTFNFSVDAIDAENQDTPRSFSVTISLADPNFNLTTLLLNGDGTNAAQNNTFLDSSTNNFTITRNGNTTQGSFSPFSVDEGKWSNYFDGSYMVGPSTSGGSPLDLSTGTFTIEFWFFPKSLGALDIILAAENGGGNFQIKYEGSNGLCFHNNSNQITSSAGSAVVGEWNHIALVRNGSSMALFSNGNRIGTVTYSNAINLSSLNIARFNGGGYNAYGHLSNIRVVKNGALYDVSQTSYVVPTSPLTTAVASGTVSLLFAQSNRFIDNSVNAYSFTPTNNPSVQPFSPFAPSAVYSAATKGGSGYFDGTGDYFSLPTGNSWLFTGDHCLEAWVYWTNSTASIIYATGGGSSSDQFGIFPGSEGIWWGVTAQSSTVVPILNSWNHLCATRQGSTIRRFLNGKLITTGTNASNIGTNSGTPYVASRLGSSLYFPGNIANLRIINGSVPTDYQTASTTIDAQIFTPPTAPLTTTSQGATSGDVKLLLNFTNAGIVDATAKNVIETVGNAQISTSVVKYGTGSLAFDGTGDGLFVASRPYNAFNTGAFTLEAWVYLNSLPGVVAPIVDINDSQSTGRVSFYINSSGNLGMDTYNAGLATSSGTVSTGQWVHIACVRTSTGSNGFTFYINGSSAGTTTLTLDCTNTTLYIGRDRSNTYFWNGYIDDLRITKGLARYTSNFTPPESSFKLK